MHCRRLREEDIGRLVIIENATQVVPWSAGIFHDCYAAGYPAWVAELDGKVIGFSIVALHGAECHLLNFSVDPHHHQQGYGEQLLLHTIAEVKTFGATLIYLEVRASNLSAISLYRKMHFKQIGVRKEYYALAHAREDAWVFAKDIGI